MNRDDIVGQKIVKAYQEFDWKEPQGDLDTSTTYLRLEDGHVLFFAASVADEIEEELIPRSAKRLNRVLRKKLEGRVIKEVYRRMDGDEREGDPIILSLDDGSYVTECAVAPHGTGSSGLYFYSPTEFKTRFGGATEPM